jgi:hypothetical protein
MAEFRRPDTAFSLDPNRKDQGGRIEEPKHLAFIRTLPCLATGLSGRTEAAHLRGASPLHGKGMTPMGRKPDDCWTVPLSREAHRRQHTMNEADFWNELSLNPFHIARVLHALSGDYDAAVQAIQQYCGSGARPPWARR